MHGDSPISLLAIGTVKSPRKDPTDDFWGAVVSTIELFPGRVSADATVGLEDFSHLEVVYQFHGVADADVVTTSSHPREREDWPRVGILAQRKKNRPNRLGVSIARLVAVEGLKITVEGLDAINGSPVLDVKPVLREFFARGEFYQPEWATELMKNYFLPEERGSESAGCELLVPGCWIRRARLSDVEQIVRLSNEAGPDGKPRRTLPDELPSGYFEAFRKASADPNHSLVVVENEGRVIGTCHVVYLSYLGGEGREDCQVESVHVAQAWRSKGIGSAMMEWVVQNARRRNCRRVQLTTDKMRSRAHKFYERLGFQFTHEGGKLNLEIRGNGFPLER